MQGFAYHRHFIRLEPDRSHHPWEAAVIVEIHAKGKPVERIFYRDHLSKHATEAEALEAAKEFGRRMVDNFTLPVVGDGDYQGL